MKKSKSAGTWSRGAVAAAFVGTLVLPFALKPKETAPRPVRAGGGAAARLVIISPHWEGIRTEFSRAFSEWSTARLGRPVEIEWLDVGGTSDALRYVKAQFERSPEGVNIDLFFGGGVDPYIQLAQDGLLLPCRVPDEILQKIPQTLAGVEVYDAERRWFGACLSGFGIVYNKTVLRRLAMPEPTAWHDLGAPCYMSWVGSGDPRSSGSVHMAYEVILQAYGWEKGWANIVAMAGNTRNFSRAASSVPVDAATGEIACGIAIDVYAWRQISEHGPDRIGFVMPEALTVINPDGIGLLKGAPNRETAEKFVEFVLSPEGQKLWILKVGAQEGPRKFHLGRMSVLPGLAAQCGSASAVTYDPYSSWRGGFSYDARKGSLRWTILNDLLGAAIIDTHVELVAAWRRLKDAPTASQLRAELTAPPLSEGELLSMAAERWKDPEFRARMRGRWAIEALERYRRLAGGATNGQCDSRERS